MGKQLKKNKLFIVVTLLTICFFSSFFHLEAKATPKLSVEVKTGIEDIQKIERNLPITIEIENSGTHFKGDVLVNTGYKDQASHALVKSIDLEAGEKETVRFLAEKYTMTNGKNKVLLFEGNYKDGEKIAYSGSGIIAEPSISEEENAILSLDFSKKEVETLQFAQAKNNSLMYKNSNSFNAPTDARYLDAISLLMVKAHTLSSWTEEQQSALFMWIRNGGMLYLQGDAKLPEDLQVSMPFSMKSKTTQVAASELNTYFNTKDAKATVIANEAKLKKDAILLIGDSSQPLVGKMDVGKGAILQGNFASWPTEQVVATDLSKVLFEQAQGEKSDALTSTYNSLEQTTEVFPEFHISLIWLALILIAYILIIAPLLYFILNKKDKREHAWWIIPLGALLTSIAIFMLSSTGRLFKSLVQQNTITTLNDGHATTEFAHSILTNKSGNLVVETPSDTYLSRTSEDLAISKSYKNAVLKKTTAKSILSLKNLRYWDVATVVGEKNEEDVGEVKANLTIENGALTGNITNGLRHNLKNVEIWSGKKKYKIGKIDKGQTVHVSQKVKEKYLTVPTYEEEEMDFENLPNTDKELKRFKIEQMKEIIIEENKHQGDPLVVGWIDEDLIRASYDDLTVKFEQNNAVVQAFEPEIDLDQDAFSINEGSLVLQITDLLGTGYSEVNSYMNEIAFGSGEYQLDYMLPKVLTQDVVTWDELKLKMAIGEGYSIRIFNFNTNTYEKIEEKEQLITGNVANYLSKENYLRFKIKNSNEDLMIEKPKIQMKGAKKDD